MSGPVQVPDSPCFDMEVGGCRSPVSLLDMGRASPSLPIDIPSGRDFQDAQMPCERLTAQTDLCLSSDMARLPVVMVTS